MLSLSRNYFLCIILLTLCYVAFECFFTAHAALVRDEFWNSHHIYQYLHHIPYRDFIPYKSVLGYYILSLPMLIFEKVQIPLYYVKQEIALLNGLAIIVTAALAKRFFQPHAILLTLLIIIASQLFLVTSVDIRVDMLSTWIALISFLFILSNRYILSGILLAVAFLVSQKVLWFFVATNAAIAVNGIYFRDIRNQFINSLKFNTAVVCVVLAYIAFWSYCANLHSVLNSLFYDGYIQSKITWYQNIYITSWHIILTLGPLFIMLWPLTWLTLLIPHASPGTHRRCFVITTYASVMLLLMISYQQPFLYNAGFLIPGFFVLYANFFTLLFNSELKLSPISNKNRLLFIGLYTLILFCLITWMRLSLGTYLIILIPILFYLSQYRHVTISYVLLMVAITFTGIVYPLTSSTSNIMAYIQYGDYQQKNIQIANALLAEGGEYVAGTPIFYFRDQAVTGLKNLIGPQLEYINQPSTRLTPILIASLYLTPVTKTAILRDLKAASIKLYIRNNRIDSLPSDITDYLHLQYEQFSGSVYLYAPVVTAQLNQFQIKFAGNYLIKTDASNRIDIDGNPHHGNDKIYLTVGNHLTQSKINYRLKFIPQNPNVYAAPLYQQYIPQMLASI